MIVQEYLNRLVHASPVKYYVSGIDGARVTWPWRMNKAKSPEFRGAFVDASKHHILDSNFKDDTVTNSTVLDQAYNVGSDGAVLADVYEDAEKTIDALIDGLSLYREHPFTGTVVLPLQDPWRECYDEIQPHTEGVDVWWAIGGLKGKDASKKLKAAKEFRDHVGNDPHLHGLGFGVTDSLARAVRRYPHLLDSIDNSSAVDNVITGLSGEEVTTVAAMRAQAERIENLWKLTHFAADADDPAQIREPNQSGFDDWQQETATDGGHQ